MNAKRKVISAYFFAELARTMYFISISWILYDITEDATYTGMLVGLGFLPGVFLNFVFGVLVDRWNRKRLAFIAMATASLVMSCTILLSASNGFLPWIIFVTHMVLQATGSLFRPAIQAFIAELFSKEQLPHIFSANGAAGVSGGLTGALLGGVLTGLGSPLLALLVVLFSFNLAAVAVGITKPSETRVIHNPSHTSAWHDLLSGFAYARQQPLLLGLFAMMLIGQLVFHSSVGFLSVYTKSILHGGATLYGLLDASLSIGGILAGAAGGWWWSIHQRHFAVYAFLMMVAGLVIVGLFPDRIAAFIGVLFIGLGTTWIRVLLQSMQQMITEASYHGRMASFRMVLNQGSVALGTPIIGLAASQYGANMVYIVLLAPVTIGLVLSIYLARDTHFQQTVEHSA
ncbi:MFS transporter [Pontibacillus salicampi]|uniref:MFS transporter n=1 Tax=Pontibacillus salicampi TaxID=1449801 RepID=A0ABV6LQD5_9BACI